MKNKLRLLSLFHMFKQNINCYFGNHDFDSNCINCLNCGIMLETQNKKNKDDEK